MTPANILTEIGGLPFVTPTFNAKKLMTLVAIVRSNIDEKRYQINQYLDPSIAYAIYLEKNINTPHRPLHCTLSTTETMKVSNTTWEIVDLAPDWAILFSIPVTIKKLENSQLSLTNPLIPQHVYLGEKAFHNNTLAETLVHEMSHLWCSLIAEIYDFQTANSPSEFILPSGTQGKDLRGVLLASLFAAAAISYHYKLITAQSEQARPARLLYLISYFNGTLAILKNSPFISSMGQLILDQLHDFSARTIPKFSIP